MEAGFKGKRWGDVRYNATVFHLWREDQQVRASFQLLPNDPASFGFATVNVDGARSYGLEADVSWQASDTINVFASLGLLY
ncbi:MAG: TonB-dependent receptor, partial [Pseudomonadota bacterium]